MSERRSLYFVIWYSKDCPWLSPGFHDWLLDPPLSCARPPTWSRRPRLSRTTAGEGRGLRSRRRRWPWGSAGRPARTASLRPYRAEPRPLPWNLLGASRTQHGWIHDQTRTSRTMYHRPRTLPPLARPWSLCECPTDFLNSHFRPPSSRSWLRCEELRRANTVQKRATASPLSFRSTNRTHSFLLCQEPCLNNSPFTLSSLAPFIIKRLLAPAKAKDEARNLMIQIGVKKRGGGEESDCGFPVNDINVNITLWLVV